MTGQDPLSFGALLLLLMLAIGVGLIFSYHRIRAIRRRVFDLHEEHDRLLHHAQLRLAAQQAHGQAERSEGDERVRHLREAQHLWREAIQTRPVTDQAAYLSLREALDLVEQDLRELGQKPDEGP